jgi:hypothetical protein
MIVIEGTHIEDSDRPETWRCGTLFRFDGVPITVYRDTIASAYAEAVGGIPPPFRMQAPGGLTPIYGQVTSGGGQFSGMNQVITGWVYDPGPGDYDAALAQMYQGVVAAYSAHAAAQADILQVLLAQLEKTIPKASLQMDNQCKVPPAGWYCTRQAGHGGPCAALELGTPPENR